MLAAICNGDASAKLVAEYAMSTAAVAAEYNRAMNAGTYSLRDTDALGRPLELLAPCALAAAERR